MAEKMEPPEDRPFDSLQLALSTFRILTPALCLFTIAATFASRAFTRTVLNLANVGYEGLPTEPTTPGVDSPLNTQSSAPGAPTRRTSNGEEDGIVPVVVPLFKPRRGLIYSLLALLTWTYLLDGLLVVIRGVLTSIWEPRDIPFLTNLEYSTSLSFIAFASCAVAMAFEERAEGESGKWGKWYPRLMAGEGLVGEIIMGFLAGASLMKLRDAGKLDVWSNLHIAIFAVRVFTLALLCMAYTKALRRKSFVPLASLNPAPSAYGTFPTPNLNTTTEGEPSNGNGANGTGASTPQKAAGNALSTKVVYREQAANQGAGGMLKRIRILFPYLWPRQSFALQLVALSCFLLILVGRVVNLFVPIMLGRATDQLQTSPWVPLGIYVGLRFLQGSGGIITVIQQTAWIPVAQFADRSMSLLTFTHLLDLSLAYHTRRKTGEVLRILDRGSAINSFFQMLLFNMAPIFFDISVAVVLFAVWFDIWLAVMLLVVMIAYVLVSFQLTRWRTVIRRQMNDKDKYTRGIQADSLLNWETIAYFTAKDFETSRYLDATRDYQKSEFSVTSSLYVLNFVQNAIIAVALLIGCFVVAYQVNIGEKKIGDFVTFVAYLGQLVGPLNQLGTLYRVVQQNLVDTDNLMKLLNEPKEIEDRPDAKVIASAKGEIEFDNVGFSYDGKVTALDSISFKVPAGSSVALVGESGSGKSTLLRLMFRFYEPTAGSIKLDGVDIRDLTQMSYRQQIGCVPQDSVLFNETIRYNIAYGNITANGGAGPSMSDVEEAAKAAQIHDRIMSFPDGYETRVGERGVRLSGGEKQRVAIARVLIRNPPILLLDEATSALDSTTEKNIQASLKSLAEGRTSVSIAHRLSTIVDSDVILVIGNGKVAERGNHDELLAQNGMYASLWKKQIRAETEGLELPGKAGGLKVASGSATPIESVTPHHHHH